MCIRDRQSPVPSPPAGPSASSPAVHDPPDVYKRQRCRSPINHRPAAAKREAAQCDDHPDALRTIHHGTAVSTSQKTIACPKAIQNRRLHRYADPRTARRHEGAGARLRDFFSWTVHCAAVGGFAAYGCGVPLAGTARFSFGKAKREMGGALPSYHHS